MGKNSFCCNCLLGFYLTRPQRLKFREMLSLLILVHNKNQPKGDLDSEELISSISMSETIELSSISTLEIEQAIPIANKLYIT